MKRNYILLLCSCWWVAACQKPIESFVDLETHCQNLVDKQGLASLSAAVVRGDSLLWAKGFGYANISNQTAASEQTPYLIASISKTITGVAAMQLAEAGSLDLDADISNYLGFTLRNPNHPSDIISSRMLLSHVSSIVDEHYDEIGDQFYYYGSDPSLSLRDFSEGMLKSTGQWYNAASFSDSKPGTAYSYSNLASALMGYIVEKVSGQPFDQYTSQHIFQPLSMNNTSWRLADFNANDLAMPYDGNEEAYGHYTFADYPNGGLRTSVADLSKFLRMIIEGGSFAGQQILSSASVEAMLQIHYPDVAEADTQGLSFYYNYINGMETIGHSGGESGVETEMFYNPETKVGAIVFVNKDNAPSKKIEQLMEQMLLLGE